MLGSQLSTLWHSGGSAGQPVGNNLARVVEQIGFFTGLGIVIVFLAAVALGRFTVIGHRERALAKAPAVETVPAQETKRPTGTPARVPDTGDTPTIPAAAVPATTPRNTEVEETPVAGSPDRRNPASA